VRVAVPFWNSAGLFTVEQDYPLDVTSREFYCSPKLEIQEALEVPMTIGIGVLCCSKPKHPHFSVGPEKEVRPDSLVMIADTMGSTDYDSTDDLHKMYVYPTEQMYGVCAGNIEMCGEIIDMIRHQFSELTVRNHGTISQAINKAVQGHRTAHFQMDFLFTKRLPVQGTTQTPQWQHEKLEKDWEDYDTGANLLVGTFDDRGQALLYYVGEMVDVHGLVHMRAFPGFCAIGIGSRNANFWFRYRGQTLGHSVRQSAYHAYEAKVMAANAPTVNDKTEILIATPGQGPFYFSETLPADPKSPTSLPELKSMFLKYGPQDTRKDLGHPVIVSPSISRKSRPGR